MQVMADLKKLRNAVVSLRLACPVPWEGGDPRIYSATGFIVGDGSEKFICTNEVSSQRELFDCR